MAAPFYQQHTKSTATELNVSTSKGKSVIKCNRVVPKGPINSLQACPQNSLDLAGPGSQLGLASVRGSNSSAGEPVSLPLRGKRDQASPATTHDLNNSQSPWNPWPVSSALHLGCKSGFLGHVKKSYSRGFSWDNRNIGAVLEPDFLTIRVSFRLIPQVGLDEPARVYIPPPP